MSLIAKGLEQGYIKFDEEQKARLCRKPSRKV